MSLIDKMHLLCPVQFNHGGDEAPLPTTSVPSPAAEDEDVLAADNVRWDLMPPPASADTAAGSGGWVMCVSATRDIGSEEAALLSYGERPNLDFFLHYGEHLATSTNQPNALGVATTNTSTSTDEQDSGFLLL